MILARWAKHHTTTHNSGTQFLANALRTKTNNGNAYMPSTSKSQVCHYQQMQLRQVKYSNDMADALQNRSKNNRFRKRIIDSQRKKN